MEIKTVTIDEMRGYDSARLKELESQTRKELIDIRMDIYTGKNQLSGKKHILRRNLAKILTVKSEARKKNVSKNDGASVKTKNVNRKRTEA